MDCIVYNIHCTMYNIHCTMYIINCTYHERFNKYRIYMYDDYYIYNEIEDK